MKKWFNKDKIVLIVLILIILSGIITLSILGFEKNSVYKSGTKIEVYIAKGYEKQDIINIAKESFSNKFSFEEVEKLNQVASIKLTFYTEEELKNYKTKISEKYNIDFDSLEIYEIPTPKTQIRSVVIPYVLPVIIVTVLSLLYIVFRNLKSKNLLKIVFNIILKFALTLGVYFSLIVILRVEFSQYTMPLALVIYIVSLIILANNIKNNN